MCKSQENVQIGCTGYVHIAAVWMMENNGYVYSLLNWVLWMLWCYETEFRSLMAWGKKLHRDTYTPQHFYNRISVYMFYFLQTYSLLTFYKLVIGFKPKNNNI